MEDILGKFSPYLETFRGWLEVPANFFAKSFDIAPERALWIVFGVVAWFISAQLFKMFYVDTQGRMDKFILLVVVIFAVLKLV